MAEGIRIRHNFRRNQTLPVPLVFEPRLNNRTECGTCHTVHPCKVVHLNLDDTGAVIVSKEVKAKIWRVPTNGGFKVESTVADPPVQGIYPETVKAKLQGIEIGGGLGAFKGKVWRIGLMGHTSRQKNVLIFLAALEQVLSRQGHGLDAGASVAAANACYLAQT